MKRHNYLSLLTLFLFLQALYSCGHRHKKEEVEAAMQRYDYLIKKKDIDSIPLLFTPDGEMGEQAKGRSRIKRFLSAFANVRVLSQTSTSDTIGIREDSAFQRGQYNQVVMLNATDTLKLKGTFTTCWIWNKNTGWLIKRIDTRPAN